MDAQTSQKAALMVMCLLCLAPAVLGIIVGAWAQRRLITRGGWPAAFVPGFVVRWLQDRK